MADQVDEIKQKTDIVSLISEYVDLKKAGSNYKALCPFHSEKTPSFIVSSELQIYKCFGCSASGDAYSFLQQYEGMDFPEALKFLADRSGVKLKPGKFQASDAKTKIYKINELTKSLYHYILLKHRAGKRALSYLLKERELAPETIKTFKLGYSPDNLGVLEKFLLEKKGFKREDLQKAGLVYEKGGRLFDRFRGRVIFPLTDHRGNITGFAGRLLPEKESSDLAKYINTPETEVYQKAKQFYALDLARAEIKKRKEAVVVEGELDVLSSWQVGIKNTVAIKGSALTEDQARLIRRLAQRLILALDADLAGDQAARRGIEVAEAVGLEVKVARLKGQKDPDELARKNPQALKKAIKNAVGVWDFVIESVFSKHDSKTGVGKSRISRELIPVISSISDSIVQAHYAELVAKKLGVPVESVLGQITTVQAKVTPKRVRLEIPVKPVTKSRQELLEDLLMGLAFQSDPKILLKSDIGLLVTMPLAKRILEKYKNYSKKAKIFNPSDFAETLPKELTEGYVDMILNDTVGQDISRERLKNELELVKYELRILSVKNKLGDLVGQIRDFEDKDQKGKLKKAKVQFSKLSQDLKLLEEKERQSIIL